MENDIDGISVNINFFSEPSLRVVVCVGRSQDGSCLSIVVKALQLSPGPELTVGRDTRNSDSSFLLLKTFKLQTMSSGQAGARLGIVSVLLESKTWEREVGGRKLHLFE